MKIEYSKALIIIVFFSVFGCSNITTLLQERELKVDMEYAEKLLLDGRYEPALSEFERIEKRHTGSPLSDKILFNLVLLYTHTGNTRRDLNKGIGAFDRLLRMHPKSNYVEYARPLISYTKEAIELKQELEKLKGENERLRYEIEKFKDIQIQLEKREKEMKK